MAQKMSYIPYLNYGLNTFEDVLATFTKYEDGGCWIKKIDHKGGFYREITEGPFTRKEAEKKASFWCKFFTFKDVSTAKVYSFSELVCRVCESKKEKERNEKIKKYIYEEYIWQPPRGASLMCLVTGKLKILMNSIFNRNNDFEKFEIYTENLGVVKTTLFEYDIFYLEHDIESNYKASTLRKLVSDYFEKSDQLVWLYDELQGFTHTRGCKPFIIPGYLVEAEKFCMPIDLEFFKKFNGVKECKRKRKVIFEELKKCLPDYSVDMKAIGDNIAMLLKIKLITNVKSYNVRDFYISMDRSENMVLGIVYPDDQTYIKIEETENCRGTVTLNLGIKKFDSSMWLIVYLAKVFGFTHLSLTDDFKTHCDHEHMIYHNILLFLDDQPSYYNKFGFDLSYEDSKRKKEIISKYQNQDIDNFDSVILEAYDETIFTSRKLKDIAHNYFNGMNRYDYACEILANISKKIYGEISECCLHYTVDLRKTQWGELVENIL